MKSNKYIPPEVGMRVLYSWWNRARTGWEGTVTAVSDKSVEVLWDNYPDRSTTYRSAAWAGKYAHAGCYIDSDINYLFILKSEEETDTMSTPTSARKESAPVLDTRTYVNGDDLRNLDVNALIALVQSLEERIASLKAITVSSERISRCIQDLQEALTATVTELDSRP